MLMREWEVSQKANMQLYNGYVYVLIERVQKRLEGNTRKCRQLLPAVGDVRGDVYFLSRSFHLSHALNLHTTSMLANVYWHICRWNAPGLTPPGGLELKQQQSCFGNSWSQEIGTGGLTGLSLFLDVFGIFHGKSVALNAAKELYEGKKKIRNEKQYQKWVSINPGKTNGN